MIEKSKIVYIRRKAITLLPGQEQGDLKKKIGSYFKDGTTARALSPEQEAKYLPSLIGSDPNKQDWAVKTDLYWKNIAVPIPHGVGLKLEIGVKYENETDAAAKKNGLPINVANWILYQHCKNYNKVANSIEEVGKSPNIEFYIFSQEEETQRNINSINIANKANIAYAKLLGDKENIKSVLAIYKEINIERFTEDELIIKLTQYKDNNPAEFLKIVQDDDLLLKSFIQKCIEKQELKLLPNTDAILYNDDLIGNNLDEVVNYFKTEKGKVVKTVLESRIKNLKT